MVEQHGLRAHHVADGDDGKFETPRHAGCRVDRGRTGRAHAGAEHIRTDDEIALRVDRPAGADHSFPPARFLGDRMNVGDVLVAGKRMADQDCVAALGIELTIGLVGDLKWSEIDAGVEPQRLILAEAHHRRMRIIRFPRALGGINHDTELGFDHAQNDDPATVTGLDRPRGRTKPVTVAGSSFWAWSKPSSVSWLIPPSARGKRIIRIRRWCASARISRCGSTPASISLHFRSPTRPMVSSMPSAATQS